MQLAIGLACCFTVEKEMEETKQKQQTTGDGNNESLNESWDIFVSHNFWRENSADTETSYCVEFMHVCMFFALCMLSNGKCFESLSICIKAEVYFGGYSEV